jgi:hypothetical protein
MNMVTTPTARRAAAAVGVLTHDTVGVAQAIHRAAHQLLLFLEHGQPITTSALRVAMTDSFGGTDGRDSGSGRRPTGLAKPYRSYTFAGPHRRSYRVELIGFTDAMVPRPKAPGLISEILSWKLRLFIPTGRQGRAILASLVEPHAGQRHRIHSGG